MSDLLDFSSEDAQDPEREDHPRWEILVVDDDPDVHAATAFTLSHIRVAGRKCNMHHAYSGTEAREFMSTAKDIRLVLLDAVMEHADSGLEFAKYVRETLNMPERPAIILRSGQIGTYGAEKAREMSYIDVYINKTEATAESLHQLMNEYLP